MLMSKILGWSIDTLTTLQQGPCTVWIVLVKYTNSYPLMFIWPFGDAAFIPEQSSGIKSGPKDFFFSEALCLSWLKVALNERQFRDLVVSVAKAQHK